MTMIDPTTGYFENFKIPTYNLNEVTGVNHEYIDKSSARVSQFFNNKRISRYPHARKVLFDKQI